MPNDVPNHGPIVEPEDRIPQRICGRCRQLFDGDPTLHPVALAEWWACPECRTTMFGTST